MAKSPTHKFGQIIGDMLENAVRVPLTLIAKECGLYLDWIHPRKARGDKSKVSWEDPKGNKHDLDYVLELGGTDEEVGRPKAFIEIAYRRYSKHSKNKSQEIQAAVTPLSEKHHADHPFLGAILAGVFTEPSITQLKSHGFGVLYFSFEEIVKAFASVGIDANFDEDSKDTEVATKVAAYEALSIKDCKKIETELMASNSALVDKFLDEIRMSVNRKIEFVFVLPLRGITQKLESIDDAVQFILAFDEDVSIGQFEKYELNIRYNNADEIRGTFRAKQTAVEFLLQLDP